MLSKPEFIFILKNFSDFLTQMALFRISSEKERWHNSMTLFISLVKEWQEPQSQIVREPSAYNWNHPYLEGFKMLIISRITAWNSACWPRPRFNISISSLSRTYLKGMTAFRNVGTPPAGKRAACLRPHKRGNHCYSGGNAGAKLGQIYIITSRYHSVKKQVFGVRQTNTDNALKYLNAPFQILRIYFRILSVRLVPFIFSCPSSSIPT